MKLVQNEIIHFLKENDFKPQLETQSNLVYILIKVNQTEVPLFFCIRNDGDLLQMIAYIPYQLKATSNGETARLLHLLNKDLDMPGFGMDEDQNLIFYRVVLPCLEQEIDPKLILIYIRTFEFVCDSFSNAIGMIAAGQIDINRLKTSE
ncbi:MAG: YbjN domain-containing protein [Victivallaceae bacterium]